MATEVEQFSSTATTTNGGVGGVGGVGVGVGGGVGVGHDMVDMDTSTSGDNHTILSRTERRPLTLSRRRIFYQAPEFIQRLSGEDTVVEGATAKFECIFKGFPQPTVQWFKDEVPLQLTNRVSLEAFEQGTICLVIKDVIRSDEAPYRCRIENTEGSCSSTLYLSVKGSSRSPKRKKSLSPNRRMVSYPSLFPTIEEKIVEEEKEEEEVSKQEPSPLTQLYEGNKLRSRHTWPKFVGDWAFADDDDEAGPSAKGDDDVDGHGGLFYSSGSNEDDDVFAEDNNSITHTAAVAAAVPTLGALDPRFPASNSNSQSSGVNAHCTAYSSSHTSSLCSSSSCPQLGEHTSPLCKTSPCSSHNCTFCINSSSNTNSNNQRVNMTSLTTDTNVRARLDTDQSLAGRRRHWSGDKDEDLSTGAASGLGNLTTGGQDSVTANGNNQFAVTKKKQPPPKGVRKRPPRKAMNHIGGVLATSFLLSSFTFCALCIDTSPEIFIAAIFIAAFMFQVIQQLNAM